MRLIVSHLAPSAAKGVMLCVCVCVCARVCGWGDKTINYNDVVAQKPAATAPVQRGITVWSMWNNDRKKP